MSADPLFFANAVAGAACWVSYRLTFFSMSNELSPGVLFTDASTADIIVMSNTSFADVVDFIITRLMYAYSDFLFISNVTASHVIGHGYP